MKRKNRRKVLDHVNYQEAINALVGRNVRKRFSALSPISTMIRLLRHAGRTRRWMTFEVRPRGRKRTHYLAARLNSRGRIIARHFDRKQMQRREDGALHDTLALYGMAIDRSAEGGPYPSKGRSGPGAQACYSSASGDP